VRKYIIGFILGVILATCAQVYSFRVYTPPSLTDLSDTNQLANLNNYLEKLYYLVNGKFNLDSTDTIPTWTAENGDLLVYKSGVTKRLYIYIGDAWGYIDFDG